LATAAPTGGEFQGFFEVWILGEFQGAEERPLGGEVDGGFGVEEFCEAATEGGGVGEKIGGGREWDAGPVA
jgi:hypothetical protein